MTMGSAMSRLAMILRRKKVSPNQILVPQRSTSHERCEKRRRLLEKTDEPEATQSSKYISNIEVAFVEQVGDVTSVQGSLESGESFQTIRTDAQDSINYRTDGNDFTDEFCDSEKNSKTTVCSNDAKSGEKEERDSSQENINSSGDNWLFEDNNNGQEGQLDSLSWISKDGYSTEGTAGTAEGSFGDDEIINRLLVDNVDDITDCGNFDASETEVPSGRKSALTQLSLETFNSSELGRLECVRSYVQAWSPLNLSTDTTSHSSSLPGACADADSQGDPAEFYDRSRSTYDKTDESTSNQPRELHEVDSQEFCLFHQRSPEPVSRPLPDSWDLLKNDRAPWINIGYTGSEEVIQSRDGLLGDDGWQDQNNRLTLCSLSTINEENDDVNRSDNL